MKNETRIWLAIFVAAGVYLAWRTATVGMGSQYVRELNGVTSSATVADTVAQTADFSLSRTVGTWVAALLTLSVFSFLYRDNPLYRTAEAIFVGVSAAYWMVVAFWDVLVPNLIAKIWPAGIQAWAMPGVTPEYEPWWWINLVPLMLGVMLVWRLSPRGGWIAVWPLAFSIGATAGLRLVGFFQADFVGQIRNSVVPILVTDSATVIEVQRSLQNFVLLAATLVCLVYFFFSVEHRGTVGRLAQAGTWVLMISFGAGFGYTVMGRIALLAIRLEFLFDNWLWWIDPLQRRIGH